MARAPWPRRFSIVHVAREGDVCEEAMVIATCFTCRACGRIVVGLPRNAPFGIESEYDRAKRPGSWHIGDECVSNVVLYDDPESWGRGVVGKV
jgi:hypothetical protein